jgi:hypothetical protein
MELEEYLENLSIEQINKMKFDIEDFLLDMLDAKLVQKTNTKMINAFLLLFAQKLEQANLIGAITEILHYLPNSAIKNRLQASRIYLRVNDISKEYHNNFDTIIELISAYEYEEEYRYKSVNAVLNFFMVAMENFTRVNNSNLAKSFKQLFKTHKTKHKILNDELIVSITQELTTQNYADSIKKIQEQINKNRLLIPTCKLNDDTVEKEISSYSEALYSLNEPTFEKIRHIAYEHVKKLGDPDELFYALERGQAIIDNKDLLYKYLVSFGAKHKAKLYSAFEKIIDKLDGERFNIVDWGCGQAFGTMMLIEYIKEQNINLDISKIKLIEPSKLALSRGLLHVDLFRTQKYSVEAINSDIDCLKEEDILFDNEDKTLHIFSNILDVESFNLDTSFLKKISSSIKNDNLFICVSPNINDKRNSRIDLFYKYFDENFDTELTSARDTCIGATQRYEKIFEVKHTKEEEVKTTRETVPHNSSLDIYSELKSYESYLTPILDLEKLNETIEKDPEYLIFKIRKVAEVITSKIYSKHETNGSTVSFNDMIRYLSFEKNLFNKKITSNLHTIRTIGNVNVHEHGHELSSQTLDAHLMLISLLILLKELEVKKELIL